MWTLIVLGAWGIVGLNAGEVWDPPLFVVPAEGNYSWQPVPLSQLRCPPRYLPFRHEKDAYMSVQTVRFDYDFHSDSGIRGFLCHKVQWSVLCSTNFLNQHSFQYALTPLKVSELECKEALGSYQSIGAVTPHFPSPDCGWMRDSWTEKDFVEVTPHSVHYDPYSGMLIDPQFVGGKCRGSPCLCIHNGTIWMGNHEEPQMCRRQLEGLGTLVYDPKGKTKDMMLYGVDIRPISLSGSCRLNFCEREGLRLKTGEFIQIKISNSPMMMDRINVYSQRCAPEVTVGLHTSNSFAQTTDLALLDEEDRLNCIQTSQVIMVSQRASPTQLSYFSPRYPGNGMAYRINMGLLECALVRYVGVYSLPQTKSPPDLLGYSHNKSGLYWKDWVFPNRSTLFKVGPNGLLKKPDGKILIPHIEALFQYYDLAITSFHDIHAIEHPSLKIISNFSDELPVIMRPGGQDESIGGVIGDFFAGLGGKISSFLIGLALLIGLICLAKCLCRCRPGTRKTARVSPGRKSLARSSSRWKSYGNTPV